MIDCRLTLSKRNGDCKVRVNMPDSLTVWIKSLGHPEHATIWGLVDTAENIRDREPISPAQG